MTEVITLESTLLNCFSYDAGGGLQSTTDAAGGGINLTYDLAGTWYGHVRLHHGLRQG